MERVTPPANPLAVLAAAVRAANDFQDSMDRVRAVMGVRVVESPYVPERAPTPGEDARRAVRHGMADILAWLGQAVGPAPGEPSHSVIVAGDTAFVHPDQVAVIRGL